MARWRRWVAGAIIVPALAAGSASCSFLSDEVPVPEIPLTSAERDCLTVAAALTDAQLTSLARGMDVWIPRENLEYLASMAATLDARGGALALAASTKNDAGARQILGNALSVLANPQVHTPGSLGPAVEEFEGPGPDAAVDPACFDPSPEDFSAHDAASAELEENPDYSGRARSESEARGRAAEQARAEASAEAEESEEPGAGEASVTAEPDAGEASVTAEPGAGEPAAESGSATETSAAEETESESADEEDAPAPIVVERFIDMRGDAPESGGIDALPSELRAALTSSPVAWNARIFGLGGRVTLRTFSELESVSAVVDAADEDVRRGSDIDRAFIARAGEIAGAVVGHGGGDMSVPGERNRVAEDEIARLLSTMMSAAAPDTTAVHDAFVTGREGGPQRLGEIPGGSFVAPGIADIEPEDARYGNLEYSSAHAIGHLLAFDWPDDPGIRSGAEKLFGNLGDSDVIFEGPEQPAEAAAFAGEATGELARIVAAARGPLLKVDGYGDRPMGVINPGVSMAVANAIGPRLLELSGDDGGRAGLSGARPLDSLEQASDVIAVLATSSDAARALATHAADGIFVAEAQYAGEPEGAVGDEAADDAAVVHKRIDAALTDGLRTAWERIDARGTNAERERVEDMIANGIFYDPASSVLTKAPRGVDVRAEEPFVGTPVIAADASQARLVREGERSVADVLDELGLEVESGPGSARALYAFLVGAPADRDVFEREKWEDEDVDFIDGDGSFDRRAAAANEELFVELAERIVGETGEAYGEAFDDAYAAGDWSTR